MMQNSILLAGLLVACAAASADDTGLTVTRGPNGCGEVVSCEKVDGKWEIILRENSGTSGCGSEFFIMGDEFADGEVIRFIRVYNEFNVTTSLYIGDLPSIELIADVEEIRGYRQDLLGEYVPVDLVPINIAELYIDGDLGLNGAPFNGKVWCLAFGVGRVNGNLNNELRVAKGGPLNRLDIEGSLLGRIGGPDDILTQVTIGGDLGRSTAPQDGIYVDNDIKYIAVGGDVNATISTIIYEDEPLGGTGSIGRIEVDGDFNGVLEPRPTTLRRQRLFRAASSSAAI